MLGSTSELLRQRVHGWEARNVAMWLVRRRGDLTLCEIGSLFGGIDYAAVSQRIRRVKARMHRQKHLFKTCQIVVRRSDAGGNLIETHEQAGVSQTAVTKGLRFAANLLDGVSDRGAVS